MYLTRACGTTGIPASFRFYPSHPRIHMLARSDSASCPKRAGANEKSDRRRALGIIQSCASGPIFLPVLLSSKFDVMPLSFVRLWHGTPPQFDVYKARVLPACESTAWTWRSGLLSTSPWLANSPLVELVRQKLPPSVMARWVFRLSMALPPRMRSVSR